MNFNGVNFNKEWAKTKTEAEFVAHESHHGLSEEQLKEAYGLMLPKEKTSLVSIKVDALEKESEKIKLLGTEAKPGKQNKADAKAEQGKA